MKKSERIWEVMKLKIVFIIIAIPFFAAFADDISKQPTTSSSGISPDLTINNHNVLLDHSLSQVSTENLGSKYNGRVDREKTIFLVCAGRYSIRANAERHFEALQKLGYSPKLRFDGQKEYWVVLREAKGISRAEKIKDQFQKSGISCFIEER
jgi:hypothetical protein